MSKITAQKLLAWGILGGVAGSALFLFPAVAAGVGLIFLVLWAVWVVTE